MVNTSHSVAKILQNPVLNTPGNELMKTTCTCEVTGRGIAMHPVGVHIKISMDITATIEVPCSLHLHTYGNAFVYCKQ